MSDADDTYDDLHELPIEQQVRQLANRVTELEKENRVLRDRLQDVENQPELQWDGDGAEDLVVVHPDKGFPYPLGAKASNALSETVWGDDLEGMQEDIHALKTGAVDTTDLVAGGVEPKIPIEEVVRQAANPATSDDLTANQERAVAVFRAYGGRAESWGGVLKLTSHDVKTILDDKGWSDPNNNTVKRVMKMLAQLTSEKAKEDRDPYDDGNLLTLAKEKRLTLTAEKDEWNEYLQDVKERYGDGSGVTLS